MWLIKVIRSRFIIHSSQLLSVYSEAPWVIFVHLNVSLLELLHTVELLG